MELPISPSVSPVLMLIDTLGVGGAERYVVTVATWLADQGVDVVVASSGGALVETLPATVRHLTLPLCGVRKELPRAARQVRALIAQRRPAVVVANSLAVTWVARAAQLRRRVPIVNVAHGWPAGRYRLVGPLMRVADRVVAVSPDVKKRLVDGGLDQERCTVVFNGVDCRGLGARSGPQRAQARAAMGAGPDDLLVAVVGRLTAQKAQHHVIEIASRLADRHPALRFAIVGQGARADELAELVDQQGLADRVALLGVRSDVPDLLGSADLYLNCSDWEGMPLTTIEAMASELPIVATRTEGADQLLDADCGLVVPVGDVAGMAAAISALADDPDRRARMGTAARSRALAGFSHDRMAGELAAVLTEVVSARAR